MRKLYGYQKDVLRWALPRNRIALFLEMRLGKTLITIRWCLAKGCQRILVVAPVSVLNTWQDELGLEGQTYEQIRGYTSNSNSHKWTLTTYNSLRENQNLLSTRWDCVVLDESYSIANPKAKISKVCLSKFQDVPHKAILTGCPAPESLLNYYQQMSFLFDLWMGVKNYWQFRTKWFTPGYGGYGYFPSKGTKALLAGEVAANSYELKRHQAGVGSKKVYQKHLIPMPNKLRKAYDKLETEFVLGDESTKWAVVQSIWLHRLVGGFHEEFPSKHKTKILKTLLERDLRNDQVVIWFRFLDEMSAIANMLNTHSISGDTSLQTRKTITMGFQKGSIRIICCQVGCFRYGVNLSAADTAIYYSNQWDYNSRSQSEDRILDTNPKRKTSKLIIDLLTADSIDEDVYVALRQTKPIETRLPMSERVQQLMRQRIQNGNTDSNNRQEVYV